MSNNQSDPKQPNWLVITVTAIGVIGTIIVAVITHLSTSPPSPTPTPTPPPTQAPPIPTAAQTPAIPQLKTAYTGNAVNNGALMSFSFYNVSEQADGTFTAGGFINGCNIQVSGTITSDDKIAFTAIQQDSRCRQAIAEFSGTISSDATKLTGQWAVDNVVPTQGGTWSLKPYP